MSGPAETDPGSGQPAPAKRSLEEAARAMGATVLFSPGPMAGRSYQGAASDSREAGGGRLFFALAGERTDGFEHCGAAVATGASAVVVTGGRGLPAGCENVPVLAVADPKTALADLARSVRAAFTGKVVGVTGSNGKTTTKELCAAALDVRAVELGRSSGEVLRTAGSLNSEIGLPRTVLESTGQEKIWVLEMAMRGRGEIAFLCEIASPHVGLVTNVAAAHLGRLGSLEEVARAKGEIFAGLLPEGIGVLPADEPLLEAQASLLPEVRKRRFCGLDRGPVQGSALERQVRILEYTPAGERGSVIRLGVGDEPVVVRLPLPGEHNARNAAAAMAVVLALGIPARPCAAALERVALPAHRSRFVAVAGRRVLDDCYNANPGSMAAALTTLAAAASGGGRTFAVLGDMLELGDEAEAAHRELGRRVAQLGFAGLVALGAHAQQLAEGALKSGISAERTLVTQEPAAAADAIGGWTEPGDWILLKASRALRLERVLEALESRLATDVS
jgi:UDP-N-acetylmuramoyl-tripeptide--D-alanyl-D-alanine ligase